ncbi:MAG: bifunctional 3-phenylpropionate/cinnamic acid dioxygenase ferredoxin subunit [Candidatus Eiseniibacteriota bacterium]
MADRVDRLCGVDEVPEGEAKRVKVDGRPPLAVFNLDGQFFVTDDVCTHGMASLSEGFLEDGVVECPWHGGAFDVRTGAPMRHPCVVALRTYAVEIRDGAVYAGPAKPDGAPGQATKTGGGQP